MKKSKSGSTANDPQSDAVSEQSEALARLFAEAPQRFLDRLQFLRRKLEENIGEDPLRRSSLIQIPGTYAKSYVWHPPAEFDYASIRDFAFETYEVWSVARHKNHDIDAFDGETILPLVRIFEKESAPIKPTARSTVCYDVPPLFFGFRDQVDKLQMRLFSRKTQQQSWVPQDKDIQRVKKAIAGMKYPTTNLEAVRIAAGMNKQHVSIILKMLNHPSIRVRTFWFPWFREPD